MSREQRDFDQEAATWDENPARARLASDVAAAIRAEVTLTPDMDVLDFGCGTGLVTFQLQPHVRFVTGVDSSQGMLDVVHAKVARMGVTNVRTRHLHLEKGESLEGRFHLVVSSMTLHHVKEIRPLLDQFRQVLVPAGQLCLADLDPDDGQFHANKDGVFHFGFDRAALRRTCEEAGFIDVHDRTAAEVTKPTSAGPTRTFSVFLIVGRKGP